MGNLEGEKNPKILALANQIARLKAGEAIVIGGKSDIDYVGKQIVELMTGNPSLAEECNALLDELRTVNPELSTFEARSARMAAAAPGTATLNNLSGNYGGALRAAASQTTREDYEKYGIDPRLLDIVGIEIFQRGRVIRSNYGGRGPFIVELNDLNDKELAGLTIILGQLGFSSFTLNQNELLAMFMDYRRPRRAERLSAQETYLDRKVQEFISREAGNHGQMYFIGPDCEHPSELAQILSPQSATVHSAYAGLTVDRSIQNLVGSIQAGSTAFVKGSTVIVIPL